MWCYLSNTVAGMANSSFVFWNFLECFFLNIFDLQLVDSEDAQSVGLEPADTEGWLEYI